MGGKGCGLVRGEMKMGNLGNGGRHVMRPNIYTIVSASIRGHFIGDQDEDQDEDQKDCQDSV